MSYFDNLLEALDADTKTQFTGILEKTPDIKAKFDEAGSMLEWADKNWDRDHNMTRSEYAQAQMIRNLESQIATGGDMTLEELNAKMDGWMSEKKLVDADTFNSTIESRTGQMQNLVNTMEQHALRIPYLNQKHYNEFGKLFDPTEFVTAAQKAGARSLDDFYESQFTAAERQAAADKKFQDAVAAAKLDGRKEALQERAMGEGGQSPTLDGSPNISHFQAKLMGLNKGADRAVIPEGAELGSGAIARAAALAGDRAELGAMRNR